MPRCVQKSEEKFYVPIICAQPLKVISGLIFLAKKLADTRSEFQPQRRHATGQKVRPHVYKQSNARVIFVRYVNRDIFVELFKCVKN